MGKSRNLIGQRFGRLIVQQLTKNPNQNDGHRAWLCACDCGETTIVSAPNLIKGFTKSCGCWRAETCGKRFKVHGQRRPDKTKEYGLWTRAKERARSKGLDFDIKLSDVNIPDICPLLNVPLNRHKKGYGPAPDSPSLDRIDTTKGYTRNNVWVVSNKANVIKSNSSLSELKLLVANWEKRLTDNCGCNESTE